MTGSGWPALIALAWPIPYALLHALRTAIRLHRKAH